MLNLLSFLWKNYAFFLFLLLEAISMSMAVSSGHQSAVFAYTSNQIGGQAFSSWQSITHYFYLQETNEQLANENTFLRSQLKTSFLDRNTIVLSNPSSLLDSSSSQITDTLIPAFDFMSAKVISNSIHKQKNYLMLNKGRKQGVRENMGVIGGKGAIGIIYSVSDDFSTVISILNTKMSLSAKLLSNQELGSIQWDGKDSQFAYLNSIETYIPIHVGDTIISSGYSHIFPEGILIGTISDYHTTEGSNTYSIIVKLSTNFSALNYVSIIRNRFYNEQLMLEKLEEDNI